ncbi:MAG: galactose-1-phosphate uridylyltransferase [Bryobacteraceae bacterium]
MPELRQDPATKDWVVIATERSRRPDQFRRSAPRTAPPAHDPKCPFCAGNEDRTPGELARLPAGPAPWQVRVVPNRFPALAPEGETKRTTLGGFFMRMDGVGHHEVVIETPAHNGFPASMEDGEVETVLRAWRDRYRALRRDPRVKLIVIFKNHGEAAGTSLVHPHSQIVATPVVPAYVRRKCEEALRYYDATGRCLHTDIFESERKAAVRVTDENGHFFVFHPFASRAPFETWIAPHRFRSSFGQANNPELAALARVLRRTMVSFEDLLGDPDFNLVIHSAPAGEEDEEYFCWHLQIVPRLTQIAGFEIGSGMYINTAIPEETARAVREGILSRGLPASIRAGSRASSPS